MESIFQPLKYILVIVDLRSFFIVIQAPTCTSTFKSDCFKGEQVGSKTHKVGMCTCVWSKHGLHHCPWWRPFDPWVACWRFHWIQDYILTQNCQCKFTCACITRRINEHIADRICNLLFLTGTEDLPRCWSTNNSLYQSRVVWCCWFCPGTLGWRTAAIG